MAIYNNLPRLQLLVKHKHASMGSRPKPMNAHLASVLKPCKFRSAVELAAALSVRYSRSLKASVKVQCIGNEENLVSTFLSVDAFHRFSIPVKHINTENTF